MVNQPRIVDRVEGFNKIERREMFKDLHTTLLTSLFFLILLFLHPATVQDGSYHRQEAEAVAEHLSNCEIGIHWSIDERDMFWYVVSENTLNFAQVKFLLGRICAETRDAEWSWFGIRIDCPEKTILIEKVVE